VFSFVVVMTARKWLSPRQAPLMREGREREDVDKMMPYSANLLYQAERVKNDAERRQTDSEIGMMAADLSQLRDGVVRFGSALRLYRRKRHPAAVAGDPGRRVVPANRAWEQTS
jgi:hypothetical protein